MAPKEETPPYNFLYSHDDEFGNQPSAKNVFLGLKGYSNSHGIPHILKAGGNFKVVFWSLVTLGTAVGLIIQSYNIVDKFLAYNVTVTMQLMHKEKLIFPGSKIKK